jgi:hypothetical protein
LAFFEQKLGVGKHEVGVSWTKSWGLFVQKDGVCSKKMGLFFEQKLGILSNKCWAFVKTNVVFSNKWWPFFEQKVGVCFGQKFSVPVSSFS